MKPEMQTSIHHIRGSVILLTLRIVGTLFAVDTVFAALLAIAVFSLDATFYTAVVSIIWLFHTVKFIFIAYLILGYILPWATTSYYIADHQLIKNTGILRIDEKTYELAKLREVDLEESWLGKLLNYGTLRGIVSASGYTEEFKLIGIGDAKKYERVLREYLNEAAEAK